MDRLFVIKKSILWKAFGIKLVNIYPGNLKLITVNSKIEPMREVVYANLWDKEVINDYQQVVDPSTLNLLS